MTPEKYAVPEMLARAFAVTEALAEHAVTGLAPGEIAKACGCSASVATRTLAQLQQLGYVEQARTPGRWRLGPRLPQIAAHVQRSIATARHDVEQTQQRLSRIPT